MDTPEVFFFIACTGLIGFFVLLFGTLALMRWFRHKERMVMIQQGLMPADAVKPRDGKASLAWGIGITAFGLALLCGLAPLLLGRRAGSTGSLASIVPGLLPGLIVLFMGLALIIIYFVTRPTPDAEQLEEDLPPAGLDDVTGLPSLALKDEEAAEE